MRKRKKIKWPEAGASLSEYWEVFRKIKLPKVGRFYDLSFLPKVIRDRFIRQKRRERFRRVIDHKIYANKFYPWSYGKTGEPTLILQGWYNVELAKRRYLRRYGKHALDHIRFIQGKEAIERGFKIGKSILVEGKWRTVMNKTLRPMTKNPATTKHVHKEVTQHTRGRGKYEEKKLLKVLSRQEYGESDRNYIPEVTFQKRVVLQKVQKSINETKTAIYEE